MKLRVWKQFGFPIVEIEGDLDVCTYRRINDALAELFQARPKLVCLDLNHIRSIDATGCALIRWAGHYLAQNGGRLRLIGASPDVRRVLERGPRSRPLTGGIPVTLPLRRRRA